MSEVKEFQYKQPFRLESEKRLPAFHLGYTTYGQLNADKSNVIWVFHAFTGDSQVESWWNSFLGEGKLLDPKYYFIICVNVPNSCYGSIHALDKNPETKKPYYHDFPIITLRDAIRMFDLLRKSLGIEKILLGIGGSMGGMELLEWATEDPLLFQYIIPISTAATNSPWSIALNATQRLAIETDPTWLDKKADAGLNGLKVARAIAMLSYRGYTAYTNTQQGFANFSEDEPVDKKVFRADTYQYYQGKKITERFNTFSYYFLTKMMDLHDVGRNRGGADKALNLIRSKALVIGIDSDLLFPPTEQKFIADNIKGAELVVINSVYGHDGFLLEYEVLDYHIRTFLKAKDKKKYFKNL